MNAQREIGLAIAMLVEAFNVKEITPVRVRVYEQAMQKIPLALLRPTVDTAINSRQFFPKPAELLADAEACRKALIAAHPYDGCAECDQQPGWRNRLDQPRTVERCPCWTRHQEKLASLGVPDKPLALPPARSGELEQVTA